MDQKHSAQLQLFLITLVLVLKSAESCTADQVIDLPGLQNEPSFNMYSGYLQGHSAERQIHYVFVESENDAANDPVVLWLNGGPGCSSMEGFLDENGPFNVQQDGETLVDNQFSWNKVANMLYLEAPIGVGFSYNNQTDDYKTNDTLTTTDNLHALLHFFERYPQYKKNEFYLTGESYAGIYVPLLAERVLKSTINLKGFLTVNGLLDYNTNYASTIFYMYYHGLISESTFKNFTIPCCNGTEVMKRCNIYDPLECRQKFNFDVGSINMYNIYSDCDLEQNFVIGNETVPASIPCVDSTYLEKYLNNPAVQRSLNVKKPSGRLWTMCSMDLNTKLYQRTYKSTENVILKLVKKIRGFIVNGDVDAVCNFLGNEWSFDNLGLQITESRRQYTVNKQVAGFTKAAKNLRFVTVKGAGHMIPHDKPEEALNVFQHFLKNEVLPKK